MSAVETMPAVTITKSDKSDEERVVYVFAINGESIGTINHYLDMHGSSWQACLFFSELFGHGKSAKEAIFEAFGKRLEDMQGYINRAKAISVEHGDELMKLAEELK